MDFYDKRLCRNDYFDPGHNMNHFKKNRSHFFFDFFFEMVKLLKFPAKNAGREAARLANTGPYIYPKIVEYSSQYSVVPWFAKYPSSTHAHLAIT